MDTLISIESAARTFGLSVWTVRAWIAQGRLGSTKLGRRRLVPQSEIDRLLQESFIPARVGKRKPAR
jgi:excisionase family DNA binding protein